MGLPVERFTIFYQNIKGFTCDTCGRGYMQRRSLWRHKKYECQKEPAFNCHICNMKFKQNTHLKSHMYVHRGQATI
nr:unnamed protein product [Callosobruchus chinensis]